MNNYRNLQLYCYASEVRVYGVYNELLYLPVFVLFHKTGVKFVFRERLLNHLQ